MLYLSIFSFSFKAPSSIISKLDSLLKNKICGVGERNLGKLIESTRTKCVDKRRGLGIKNLKAFKLALLGKWEWRKS